MLFPTYYTKYNIKTQKEKEKQEENVVTTQIATQAGLRQLSQVYVQQ